MGQRETYDLMKHIDSTHPNLTRDRAMDFGCGVGRVTQPLAHYFNYVCGVDISPTMIELARKYNQYPDRCQFYLNEADDLSAFEDSSFSLVYSNLTLQHMEKKYFMTYLREFLRVLTREGLIVFQMPSNPPFKTRLLGPIYWRLPYYHSIRFGGKMEMHWVEKNELQEFSSNNGGRILEAVERSTKGWRNYRYCVTKD